VVDLRTNFLCVSIIVASPRESEESQDNAVLSQGINDRGQRFQTQTKPAVTGSVDVEMSFSSEKVIRLRIIFAGEKTFSPSSPKAVSPSSFSWANPGSPKTTPVATWLTPDLHRTHGRP